MNGTINKNIPIAGILSFLCKKIIKKKAIVIISLANEASSCCLFLFLNWKIAKIDREADNRIQRREYEKLSFKKKLVDSFCKTGKL